MCGSSDFLDIKEYSRELRKAIYPNLRKNLNSTLWKLILQNYIWKILTQLSKHCLFIRKQNIF